MLKKFIVALLMLGAFIAWCRALEHKDSDECLSCHSNALNLDKKSLHPLVKKGQCLACHTTYNKEIHTEEIKPVLEICENCHDQSKLGRSHPVGAGIIDPNTNTDMTCVSTCHLVHGSDYKYQLAYENNMRLCLSCHKEF